MMQLLKRIKRIFHRPPDFQIGEAGKPYMLRWFVIPHNRYLNIYLHNIRRSDDDRALHDHPWWNMSILLKGSYNEMVFSGPAISANSEYPADRPVIKKHRKAGSIVFRNANQAHRLELVNDNSPVWTLFITGPKCRDWGFYCKKGWVHWKNFVSKTSPGLPGPGCEGPSTPISKPVED